MGFSILDAVVVGLQEAGFHADVAYPGQKYPTITETAAAVHIKKVDRADLTVTLEVTVICPGSQGGTQCELEALRATEVLRTIGAVCVQNGCAYDGIAQVYCVDILATFTCVTEEDSYRMGPGFQVYINDIQLPRVTSFTAERYTDSSLAFTMGDAVPAGSYPGCSGWKLTVEEQIPPGEYEMGDGYEPMTIRLEKSTGFSEVFTGCRWTSVKRELNRRGVHRIRTGIAVDMQEVYDA